MDYILCSRDNFANDIDRACEIGIILEQLNKNLEFNVCIAGITNAPNSDYIIWELIDHMVMLWIELENLK